VSRQVAHMVWEGCSCAFLCTLPLVAEHELCSCPQKLACWAAVSHYRKWSWW